MSEKTEKPTPKKIRDARKKGQVAQSKEVVSAALLMSLVLFLWATADLHIQVISEIIILPSLYYDLPFTEALKLVFENILSKAIMLTIPLLLIVVTTGILANYLQIGPLFVLDPIKPKMEKISIISGFKKIFAMKNLFEFIKSIVKILFLSILVYLVILNNFQDLLDLPTCGKTCLLPLVGHLCLLLLINSIVAFLIIAIIDYVFQKAQHIKQLKMSIDEIRREYKESEGNPEIKSQRKQLHRELLNSDVKSQVSGSSVIVTNPTHVAIGLYYEKGKMPLPKLTIKGVDSMAQQIKRIAYDEGIPVMENVPLARALLAYGEINNYIPDELINSVAEVMSWVENLEDS